MIGKESIAERYNISEERVQFLTTHHLGNVAVISGRSGVGKDTLIRLFLDKYHDATKGVSATTRKPRENELNGIDYHFLTTEEFQSLAYCNLLIDHTEYVDNHYGIPKKELEKREKFRTFILNVVPQTAAILKKLMPDAKTFVIVPPCEESQLNRLKKRNSESENVILQRLNADREAFRGYESVYDYKIVSKEGCVQEALTELQNVIYSCPRHGFSRGNG